MTRSAAIMGIALALAAPSRAQAPGPRTLPVDVQIIVLHPGAGDTAQISYTYRSAVAKGEPQRDLAALAAVLRQPVPKARITTESIRAAKRAPRLTSVETTFRGLLDRPRGRAHVEPFARAFARFPHVRVTYFVDTAFRLKEPVEDALGSDVSATISGQAPVINVDLWRGPATPAAAMPGNAGDGRGAAPLALLFVLLAATAAGVAVYIVARAWIGQRGKAGGNHEMSGVSQDPDVRLTRR